MKKLVQRWREDKDFRLVVTLYSGATINFFFVGFELYGGIRYQSVWFTALAVYYAVLTVVKLYVGLSARRRGTGKEWRVLRVSGWVIAAINLALSVMISIMIAEPSITMHEYSKMVAIAMATWTFYLLISAIIDLTRLRGKNSPWRLAGRLIKLISAVVSILMLQTTMVATFGASGTGAENFLAGANRATGIAVGLFVLGLTIYMIVKGTREEKGRRF